MPTDSGMLRTQASLIEQYIVKHQGLPCASSLLIRHIFLLHSPFAFFALALTCVLAHLIVSFDFIVNVVFSFGIHPKPSVWFAIALGNVCVLLAITGALLLNYFTSSHPLRLVTTPLFWLGIITLTCGLHRTCPVIFIFGSYRQIHGWEAVRESEHSPLPASSGTHISLHNTITLPTATPAKPHNWPQKKQSYELPPATTDPKNLLFAWDSALSDNSPNTLKPALLPSQPSTPTLDNPLLSRLNNLFILPKDLKATPIFGPVTRVISPLVIRAQRRYVFTAVAWASLFTTLWIPFWLLIPSPSQRHD